MRVHGLALFTALLLTGCAGGPGGTANEALPPTHPASPAAAEAPPPARSETLSLRDTDPAPASPGPQVDAAATGDGHAGHEAHEGHGSHGVRTCKSSPGADHGHHGHHEGGTATPPAAAASPATRPATYTCPHHPEVVSERPGECPKCHMDLEKKDGKGA